MTWKLLLKFAFSDLAAQGRIADLPCADVIAAPSPASVDSSEGNDRLSLSTKAAVAELGKPSTSA